MKYEQIMFLCRNVENIIKDLITLKEQSINVTGKTFVHNFKFIPKFSFTMNEWMNELTFIIDSVYMFSLFGSAARNCPANKNIFYSLLIIFYIFLETEATGKE